MNDNSIRRMRESMLEQTDADEWDELPSGIRIKLLAQQMDDTEDLAEEEARWLKEESGRAMDDLKDALQPLVHTLSEIAADRIAAFQRIGEVVEVTDNNAER